MTYPSYIDTLDVAAGDYGPTTFIHYPTGDDTLVELAPVFDLPVICVQARGLAEGWERSLLELWRKGTSIPTQYDRECGSLSRDAMLVLSVAEPFSEPRLHRALPGGVEDIAVYIEEVCRGVHDHWIDKSAGKWQYSYHQRLTKYEVPGLSEAVNQLDYIVTALSDCPHTRRAQAVLWQPWEDAGYEYPCCLQRIWMRVFNDRLVCNVHMRSNDALRAAMMNLLAFTEIQSIVADRVSERLGRKISVGQYTHVADSYHIYGESFPQMEKFLELMGKRTFAERTFRTEDVKEIMDEAKAKLAAKIA
jgi:thymidylate synthase